MNQLQIATVLQFGKNLKHTVGSCVLGSTDVEKETLKKTRVVWSFCLLGRKRREELSQSQDEGHESTSVVFCDPTFKLAQPGNTFFVNVADVFSPTPGDTRHSCPFGHRSYNVSQWRVCQPVAEIVNVVYSKAHRTVWAWKSVNFIQKSQSIKTIQTWPKITDIQRTSCLTCLPKSDLGLSEMTKLWCGCVSQEKCSNTFETSSQKFAPLYRHNDWRSVKDWN